MSVYDSGLWDDPVTIDKIDNAPKANRPIISKAHRLHGVGLDERAQLVGLAKELSYYQDFDKSVQLDWVIKGILAKGHTSHLFGPPGGGKSALLGNAAVSLGSQSDWYGFKVRNNCATVYFPFERPDLVKKRIWAQCQRDKIENVPIAVAAGLADLMNPSCVNEIIGTMLAAEDNLGMEVALGIFDTVGKGIANGGGDENLAKDQNRAWGNLRRVHEGMARYHGVHLAGIGHTGKDENRGARGSNAAKGDNDVELQIRNDGTIKSVEISKANELPDGPLMRFKMEPYDTGLKDEDGDPIEVWIPAPEVIEPIKAKDKSDRLTKNQQTVFAILHEAGAAGLTTEEWNERLRAEGIGVKRRADPGDIRRALKDKNMVREYSGRWYVNHQG